MRISVFSGLIAIVLAGCATPAEQAAEAERDVERMMLIYGPACEKLGFKANTDPWRNCVIGLSQKDAARQSSNMYHAYPFWHRPYWVY
jgi:hypothetical protein